MLPVLTSRRALPVVAAVLLSLTCGSGASAQLGGLRRAVERRVEKKAEERVEDRIVAATLIPPTFDATTVELTPVRIDRYITAMERRKAALAANRQEHERLRDEASRLREQAERADNRRERDAYEKSRERFASCRRDFVRDMERDSERQTRALQQRIMSNPGIAASDPKMKEIAAGMQALVAAQQSGDTAAVRRATERMANVMGTSVDSAAIDAKAAPKCGAWPAKPRSMVESDALRAKADETDKAANALLSLASAVKGEDVGLTDAQALMIYERIQSWLNGVRDNAPITRTFTKAEYEALVARRDQLKKAFNF